MKEITSSFLVLSVVLLGASFALPGKASAGALTSTQIANVLNLLQQYGVSSSVMANIGATLTSPSATTSTTTTTTTLNGCLPGYLFNIYIANTPCPTTPTPNTTPTTLGGSYTPPGTVNPNAQYPYGTTSTTPPSTTTAQPNYCVSNTTSLYAYNILNGYQCVKVCPTTATALSSSIVPGTNLWNAFTNTLCPALSSPHPTAAATTMTVIYPNGAESFEPGDSVGIKWESSNISTSTDTVFILLNYYTPEGVFITNTKLVDNYVPNDGSESVKLPTDLPAGASWGNNFTVTVGIPNYASDSSDKNFTIE